MFNRFAFERRIEDYKKMRHYDKKQKLIRKKHVQDREILLKNYRKKVYNLLKMLPLQGHIDIKFQG